nr:GatB/YqeY domain-containing protein [Candidatus Hakubella thermalkaliphila]
MKSLNQRFSKSTIQVVVTRNREAGIAGMKDMGRLMKELMPKLKGKADGKLVSQRVKEILEKEGRRLDSAR